MVGESRKSLVDANTLMTAARLYYAYDIMPSFWEAFEEKVKDGDIVLLDMVKGEIDRGEDQLKKWVNDRKDEFTVCNHVDSRIISKYAEVMQYVHECGFYNEQGLNSWAVSDVADPWLVATAATYDYCIITFEQSAGSLNEKNKSGKVKIPDVAKNFNVEVHNLYYMMRQLGIKV